MHARNNLRSTEAQYNLGYAYFVPRQQGVRSKMKIWAERERVSFVFCVCGIICFYEIRSDFVKQI